MSVDPMTYKPAGDKKNSAYFNEYLPKIYERRASSGLGQLLGNICGVAVQVQAGDAISYLKELYVMTPYRYKASFRNDTHNIYCLVNRANKPVFFVLEPLSLDYKDNIVRINKMYPNSRAKPQARYIGEIFGTKDREQTKTILKSHSVRFYDTEAQENQFYSNPNISFTHMSNFTYNRMGYTSANLIDFDSLELGMPFSISQSDEQQLAKQEELSIKLGVAPLLNGLDHLAARVLASDREDAILELLCLTNYYFWGAFDVPTMDTATCATRSLHGDDGLSPAKVISASDVPYMVNSFANTPMPTEDYVRNYGRRLHHIAYAVLDGDHASGVKNIDFVIATLHDKEKIEFVSKIVGACNAAALRQVFATHSPYSTLFTEYVQRCHGFEGFLNRENVVQLAGAMGTAGEKLQEIAPTDKPKHDHNIIGD
ncbi:MAG: hypothetical protein V4534_00375 [Myxococcota bacterium]